MKIRTLLLLVTLIFNYSCSSSNTQEEPSDNLQEPPPRESNQQITAIQLLIENEFNISSFDESLCEGRNLNILPVSIDDQNISQLLSWQQVQWEINDSHIAELNESNQLILKEVGQTILSITYKNYTETFLIQVKECVFSPLPTREPVRLPDRLPVIPIPIPLEDLPEAPVEVENREFSKIEAEPKLIIQGELNDLEEIQIYGIDVNGNQELLNDQEVSRLTFTSSQADSANLDGTLNILWGNQPGCSMIELSLDDLKTELFLANQLEDMPEHNDAYIDRIVCFIPGYGAGFDGTRGYPDTILGGPRGRGNHGSSHDVLSLGANGILIVESETDFIDGPGPDFIVSENNTQYVLNNEITYFPEPAIISVSLEGQNFASYDCDPLAADVVVNGCGGFNPVYVNVASRNNNIDPMNVLAAGGDAFDLNTLGIDRARFVMIKDLNNLGVDAESVNIEEESEWTILGFDLDAITFINRDE